MGNLSNPSINRWGLNLFWYRYWYTDKLQQAYIQQDYIFNQLLYTYILYGILTPHNLFLNKYWHMNIENVNWKHQNFYNEKYYRKGELKGLAVEDVNTIRLRFKVKHLYFSKIWILRFQNWVILNFYSFQPIKKSLRGTFNYSKHLNTFKAFSDKKYHFQIRSVNLCLNSYLKVRNDSLNVNYTF